MPKLSLFDPDGTFSDQVVIVEDEEQDFKMVKKSFDLADFENQLVWLKSGEELLDYLNHQGTYKDAGHLKPMLVFLDLNLPGIDGEQVLETLEAQQDLKNIPIVLLTGLDIEAVQKRGIGNYHYIQKPLTFDKTYDYVIQSKKFLFQ